jgi:hypothetical protein
MGCTVNVSPAVDDLFCSNAWPSEKLSFLADRISCYVVWVRKSMFYSEQGKQIEEFENKLMSKILLYMRDKNFAIYTILLLM